MFQAQTTRQAVKVKCLVIDLDNTLWEGILIEDGKENLSVNSEFVEILKKLDERGILLSIASKNNADEVVAFLKELGIEELFIFPKINWEPKSNNIAEIAEDINIGTDTIAFIDDNQFELEEVRHSFPEIKLINALDFRLLIQDSAFMPEKITKDAKNRRAFYSQQMLRKTAEKQHKGMFRTFLKDCNIKAAILPAEEKDIDRISELILRTNQMNFSTNRHSPAQVRQMFHSPDFLIKVIDAEDKFGSYGTTGVLIINVSKHGVWDIHDLMFSCRIQGKGVDEAVITQLLITARERGIEKLFGNFKKTQKNRQFLNTYSRLGFKLFLQEGDQYKYLFCPQKDTIPQTNHVSVFQGCCLEEER